MTIAYFDCFSGAGGDMIVASLIDAGADADALRASLASLGVEGYTLSIERIRKQGFASTRFNVELDKSCEHPHRRLRDITEIIGASRIPRTAKDKAARVFERLAEAEAGVHGIGVDEVHFHEVGAVDAIVDVVAAMLGLEMLGVEQVICSPIPTGSGTVVCAHGVLPVPAPATAQLLKGVPIVSCEEPGEMTTPTAAAVLTTLAESFGTLPSMRIRSVGYGAGKREGKTRPNLLRVIVGEPTVDADSDEITVLETNIDDATPEVVGYCMERLLDGGALDVYAVPIHMKKSRTGVVLTVLCEVGRVSEIERILFAETPTFGIRRHRAERTKLIRRCETVQTAFGEIRVKVGKRGGEVSSSPEFEDCKAAAHQHGVALREVIAAAQAAWTARSHGEA